MKNVSQQINEKGMSRSALLRSFWIPMEIIPVRRIMMKKILCAVCILGCVLMSSALGKITYIDAELGNTTIDGAAPSVGVNYSTDYSTLEGLWGWRTNRTDVNGAGIWVTDGGAGAGEFDREETPPLKIDVTLPEAGILYDLYAIIMNNNSGTGRWDVAARIGDSGDFIQFNRDSEEMTQALATDFDGPVTVSGGGDMTMKVLIGQYLTTVANETVSIYINGLDTWGIENLDQRTRFDGVGFDVAGPTVVSPVDGETGVAVDDASLSWIGGQDPNAVGHYVYLGTASDALTCLNPDSKLPVNTGTYSIGTIEMNTTYYWQIEVSMENGQGGYPAGDPNNIFGPVWSFTTVFSIPIITEQPSYQVASTGGSAEFTVGVESLSTPTFAWYYSTDKATDTAGDDIFLSTDQTLTVSNVTIADEGYYYCRVNNESGTEVVSSPAGLGITRLVAHWSLDAADYVNDQYQDQSGEGHHADPNGTPAFVAGQLDEGISILRPDGSAVPATQSWASAGTWDPSEFSGMLTVSFWLKWDGQNTADSEQVIVSKRSSDSLGDATQWQVTRPGSNSNKDL